MGDVLLSVRAPVGLLNRADRPYCIGRGLTAIRFKHANARYGWHMLGYFVSQLNRVAQGSTFQAISKSDLETMTVVILPDCEQTVIAAILDTVDETIQQTSAVIEKLKKIKAGLLHDLMTRGIDKDGQLRDQIRNPEQFKDSPLGKVPKEWSETEIGAKAIVTVGGTPSTTIPSFWNGTIRWMSSGDIHQKRIYDVSGRITERGLLNSSTCIVDSPAVAIALAGQGKTRGTAALTLVPLCTNQSVALIKPNEKELSACYLFHNLDFRYDELRARSLGGGRAGLTKTVLERVPLVLPRYDEQIAIAAILDSHDERMKAEKATLRKLRLMKQGLMQDLLTGRVRVPKNMIRLLST
ncbi:MAG: restriction endonuclease subunit S [Patescibacteria group bacterium]